MKIIFVIALFSVILLSAEAWAGLKYKTIKSSNDCKLSSGVDPELMTKALKGEFIDDPKHMKFTLCLSQKMNIMDTEGNFKKNNVLSNLLDNTKLMLKSCAVEGDKEIGNGQKAFTYFRCVAENFVNDVNITRNVLN